MNSYVLIIRMLYQIATHEAVASFESGILKGDYTDILDHCDNLSKNMHPLFDLSFRGDR